MSSRDVVMIAPLSVVNKRTRLTKMVKVLNDKGFYVRFFGWEREKNESKELAWQGEEVSESVLLRGGGYASRRARLMYPLWMLVVFIRVLFLGRKKTFFCLGWETAFPALLASLFTKSSVVFDDADRFSMIIKLPGLLDRFLRSLEKWASYKAALHIVPSFSRYEWCHDRMYILRNAPLHSDFERARQLTKDKVSDGLVLYANGWIGETRGAPVFLELLDLARERGLNIAMIIAGRVDGPGATKLLGHPLVHYVGEVSQQEALSWYGAVDLLLTFYDPAVSINRKAESNKWGDAVYFAVPFVVNSEVVTAHDFVEKGAAWRVPYADVESLFSLIQNLAVKPEVLSDAAKRCSEFRDDYPTFDEGVGDVIKAVLRV